MFTQDELLDFETAYHAARLPRYAEPQITLEQGERIVSSGHIFDAGETYYEIETRRKSGRYTFVNVYTWFNERPIGKADSFLRYFDAE